MHIDWDYRPQIDTMAYSNCVDGPCPSTCERQRRAAKRQRQRKCKRERERETVIYAWLLIVLGFQFHIAYFSADLIRSQIRRSLPFFSRLGNAN